MEVLSLLKYWRGSGGGYQTFVSGNGIRSTFPITTISASATPPHEDESTDDDGPFFDLEFSVPDDESDGARLENDVSGEGQRDEASDDEREFDLTLTSGSTTSTDLPAEELFVKGGSKPQMLNVSLLRTKLRVLMLGLRKQKNHTVDPHSSSVPEVIPFPKHTSQRHGKPFTVKFKVEEAPIVSLFTRDNSWRNGGLNSKPPKQQTDDCLEKKPSKELVQKYLGKIKPLYVRVSKRHGEKSKISEQSNSDQVIPKEDEDRSSPSLEGLHSRPTSPKLVRKENQSGAIPAGLRVVRKHLGKSRSASAAVAAVPSPPPAASRRRDDSLLQLQDGIQSAIAHCKMSLSVSRGWFVLSATFLDFYIIFLFLLFLDPEASADCGEKARENSM